MCFLCWGVNYRFNFFLSLEMDKIIGGFYRDIGMPELDMQIWFILWFSCSEERCSSAVQMETRDSASSGRAEGREQGECGSATGTTGVSLQSSISKIIDGDGFRISSSVDIVTVDHVNIGDVEPLLRTTKEKECWHLYRRMCDKGVCVSFDTVLR